MAREIVIALYKPKRDNVEALEALIAKHEPTLRGLGLVTERPFIRARSHADGSYLEIFEWASHEAAQSAHDDPAVQELWTAMAEASTFIPLAELQESTRQFPHFAPLED